MGKQLSLINFDELERSVRNVLQSEQKFEDESDDTYIKQMGKLSVKNVNVVVMGKTGAGKSTLINAVLGKDVAEEGQGQSITRENQEYEESITLSSKRKVDLKIYDTVGLEIDTEITKRTINAIKKHIDTLEERSKTTDISVVWFCVNARCNRFEKYELNLIKNLSIDKCIPFIILITQCLDNRKGELEKSINEVIPEIPVVRVLAKEYETRAGRIEPYGISNLLAYTIRNYPKLKVSIATSQFEKLCEKEERTNKRLEKAGYKCVKEYTDKAQKVGFVPVGCIPIVHGICVRMISELNSIFGIKDAGEVFTDVVLGVVVTPVMAIPLISIAAASAYVETVGERYVEVLMNVIRRHSNYMIEDKKVILEEIRKELEKTKS